MQPASLLARAGIVIDTIAFGNLECVHQRYIEEFKKKMGY